jgi:hypothetical protein
METNSHLDYPIEYKFLDENFEQMYTAEDQIKIAAVDIHRQ